MTNGHIQSTMNLKSIVMSNSINFEPWLLVELPKLLLLAFSVILDGKRRNFKATLSTTPIMLHMLVSSNDFTTARFKQCEAQ